MISGPWRMCLVQGALPRAVPESLHPKDAWGLGQQLVLLRCLGNRRPGVLGRRVGSRLVRGLNKDKPAVISARTASSVDEVALTPQGARHRARALGTPHAECSHFPFAVSAELNWLETERCWCAMSDGSALFPLRLQLVSLPCPREQWLSEPLPVLVELTLQKAR